MNAAYPIPEEPMTPAFSTALPRKAILLSFSLACLPYEQKAFAQANDCAVLLARPPLTGCAAKFAAPGLDDTAVKRLTKEQARNIVAWLHLQGKLTLNEPFVPRFDASCKLVSPGAGDVLSVK